MPDRIGAPCVDAEQGLPMKFVYLLALSALAIAPVAQAQISCKQANELVAAADEDFAAMSGKELGDGVYEASYLLDGAAGCQVTSDWSVAYSCMWTFDSLAGAQAAYGASSHALAECFSGWERDPYAESSGEDGVKTIEGASYYSTNDDGAEYTWLVYVEEHVANDGRDWHVWVGLDYF